ncbi:MAG: acyl-CoA thioesterase [Anaerolineae bacterium]
MSDKRPSKPMRESQVSMMELVMPDHANVRGNIFGGRVMSLIDIAGAMAALRHCRYPVVTASVDRLDFRAPIRVGEFIMLHANVNYAGRTSMEVGVRVVGEHPLTGEQRHTATAFLTYVALDEQGRPVEIPDVLPETEVEELWHAQARHRRALRLAQRQTDTTP